jgi:hypothetical protein
MLNIINNCLSGIRLLSGLLCPTCSDFDFTSATRVFILTQGRVLNYMYSSQSLKTKLLPSTCPQIFF